MSSQTTRIVAVRHAETVWNIEGRHQGHLDSPLTSKGEAQVRAVADRLAGQDVAALYTSDLGRAVRMAEAIGPVVGREPVTDRRLRERHYGVFQGLTLAEMADRHPDALARYMDHNPDYAIPGGESISDRLHRSSEFLKEVVSRHPGRTIIVVTHGGVLDGWLRLGLGLGLTGERSFALPNAGVNLLRADDSGWIADVWADVSHLPDGF